MIILKCYKDRDEEWFIVSLSDCIEHTEKDGYWKPDTVEQMLKDGNVVFTPFAEYKLGEEIMKKATIKKDQYRGGKDSITKKVNCPYCNQSQTVVGKFESEREHICTSCGNPFKVILEV